MSSTNTLNDVQLAELRKAFAVFDQDGNGRIDLNEMKQLLSSLLGKNASDDEAAQIMKLVDNDNSGDVDFDEFAKVMENWLASDFKSDETGATTNELSSPTTRKRKKAGNDERHDLHKRVRSFFTQFHPVAATASDALESVRGGMRTDEHSLVNNSMMRDVEAYTSAAKLDFLLKFRATMTNFANLVSGLRKALETGVVVASKEAEATEITRCIAQCLSVCDVFPTPAERRGVADDIVQLFELIVQLNLVPLLAKGLKVPSNDVAAASARCLGTIANGPRIASTPVDSLLHPSQMFFKKLVISEGVVPLLITMLSSHVADVRDEALLALAAIAEHDPTARDFVLAARALPPILNLIQAASPLTTVRKAVFATAVLCGVTHPMSRLPPWPEVQPSLERVALALFCDDDETIATACRALAILLPGCTELSYDRRLVQLMATENAKVAAAVLSTIQSIVTYDDQQTQVLLRCSLLTGLRACLKNADAHVRLSAVEVCSTLVGAKGQVQVLIDAKLVPMLLTLLKVDSSVRFRVATLVKYLSRGTPRQVGYLAEQEAVAACCGVLSHFKVYDPVLIKAYGYVGPSFNFEFVHDLLAALDNIVNVGAVAAADAGRRINDNALHFDLEAIDKLRQMLATIRDAGPTVVAAWRQERGDSEPIEHVCGRLLLKVRAAHQHAMSQQNSSNPASAAVAAMVDAVLNEFYQSPEATAAEKVLLKCQLGDDIRVVEVFRDVSYDDLKLGMSQKWGTTPERLQLKYSDADGDQVVIDGQGAWHKALEEHAASGNASLRLYAALAADTVTGFQSLQSPVLARRSVANANNSNNETRLDASAILKSSSFNVQPENPAGAAAFKLDFTAARSDELSSLVANTRFTTAEIESLRSTWASQSSNGTVGREAFAQGLEALGVTDPLVIEQNFSLFDRDNNGEIDFREFVTGLSVLQRGTTDEKLRLLFDAYDLDSNGQLDRDELYQIYKASLSFSGKQQFKTPAEQHQAITQMVEQCFALVDDNKDGVLQFEEFKKAVESQAIVLESLIHVPISIV